jgi:hypothetical protein
MAQLYYANDKYNATLSQGYTVGDTTLYVNTVPTNVPTIVVVKKGTSDETVFTVTGKTSNSLTGVARLKGANVNIDTNAPVTCLNNAEFINQFLSVGVEAWNDASDGATINLDLTLSKKQRVTLGGNRTLAISGDTPGMAFIVALKQDATGGRTVTWWNTIQWVDGTAPTLTTTANKADVFGFIQIATNQYYGFIVGQNL